jgi:hypothetical protein
MHKLAYQKIGKRVFNYINISSVDTNIEDIIGKIETKYIEVDVINKLVHKDTVTGKYKYIDKCDTVIESIKKHINADVSLIINSDNKDAATLLVQSNEIAPEESVSYHVIKTGDVYELYKKSTEQVDIGYVRSCKVLKYKVTKVGEYIDPQL